MIRDSRKADVLMDPEERAKNIREGTILSPGTPSSREDILAVYSSLRETLLCSTQHHDHCSTEDVF